MAMNLSNNTDNIHIPVAEIIDFWFPYSILDENTLFDHWFDKSPDEYIKSNYLYLIDYLAQNETNYLKHIETDLDKLVLLIIGDQFTRNAYRNDNELRTKNDIWTLKLALLMLDYEIDLKLNLNMRYSILLVLRHQKTTQLLNRVINRIKLYLTEYTDKGQDIPTSLIKFYTHTIRSYTELTDSIKISNNENTTYVKSCNYEQINDNIDKLINLSKYIDILDTNVFENIDDKNNFNNGKQKNIIYKTLYEWIIDYKSKISKKKPINIGISLSGGVDSMVLLSCLVKIKFDFPKLIKNIIAIHIEHSNRYEAVIEKEFLIDYCNILGVNFYWRTIDYMNREMQYIDRTIYETESKKVRFSLYKYLCKKHTLIGVCIGHHMGDITENVFTNIIKGRNISNLGVMKKMDEQYDVVIHRPLLELIKEQIISYAKNSKTPYFKNSTPTWSCRGVIRDKLIPILKEQFGDFESNIIKTMNTCSKMAELNYKYIVKPFTDSIYNFKHGIKVQYNSDMIDSIFWDPILINLLHSNNYPMISMKSKNFFLCWLKSINSQQQKKRVHCDLNKIFYAYYESETNYIYIINSDSVKTIPRDELIKYANYGLDQILSEHIAESNITIVSKEKKNIPKLPQKIKDIIK